MDTCNTHSRASLGATPTLEAMCNHNRRHPLGSPKLGTLSTVAALVACVASATLPQQPFAAAGVNASGNASLRAARTDRDLDGVTDALDNCPTIPNRVGNDEQQPVVCGEGLHEALGRYVFIQSRTFAPTHGIDPALELTGSRRHVFLHISRDADAIVLTRAQRTRLARAGVRLWEYLPHYTYYATVPGNRRALERVVALPFIDGISAIEPDDRIARSVRAARGAPTERQADGSLVYSVDFFDDVPAQRISDLLHELGLRETLADGNERFVRVNDYSDVLALANSDAVLWIDDVPGAVRNRDDASFVETRAHLVNRVHGFDGAGLTVGMMEGRLLPLPPDQHPDMTQRVIADSTGTPQFDEHNLEVAGIMVGDGSLDATNQGFLPQAVLVDYGAFAFPATSLHRYLGFPRQAREHLDAVVFNYSNGPGDNCNRLGEYRKEGRHHDRSVYEVGISVVRAVGNTRGESGVLALDPDDPDPDLAERAAKHGPCRHDNLDSLPHPVPKNDIAVGNWNLATDALDSTSAVGPAEDGRLKPDLVAPGDGVMTTTVDEASGDFTYRQFSGTSAAAPVVSGIVGQVMDAFQNATVARTPVDVPPSTVKAILLHTARDVGPWGPDYFHGWGLVDAAAAVRVALHHDDYVHEASVGESNATDSYQFDVAGTVYGFKVTLAWDDEPAARSATEALINDLNLWVTDPTGQQHFPLDTLLTGNTPAERLAEANAGARTCQGVLCQDHVNNVEQVFAVSPDGTPLPTGQWTATVSFTTVNTGDQAFSLVVTPDACPLRIYTDTTLSGPVTCPDEPVHPLEPLEPRAVVIESDDVTLNCNGHSITGAGNQRGDYAGTHTGIFSDRDRVSVSSCHVESFDTGIHLVGSDYSVVADNTVSNTDTGIKLDAVDLDGIEGTSVLRNTIEAAERRGIWARGAVVDSTISANTMNNVGASVAAIKLVAKPARRPRNNTVSFNIIDATPIGISLEGIQYETEGGEVQEDRAYGNEVFGNLINVETDIGINEALGEFNEIYGNFILARLVGIQSSTSLGLPDARNITTNIITGPSTGITVSGNAQGSVSNNWITEVDSGVIVNLVQDDEPRVIPRQVRVDKRNVIRLRDNGVGVQVLGSHNVLVDDTDITSAAFNAGSPANQYGTGILVSGSSDVEIEDNSTHELQTGIDVSSSAAVAVRRNTVSNVFTGVRVHATPSAEIVDNTVRDATVVGIHVTADTANIARNTIEYDPAIFPPPVARSAIHYASGRDGVISDNSLSSAQSTEHAILVGTGTPFLSKVYDLRIENQSAEDYEYGITLQYNTRSVEIHQSSFVASNVALNGAAANALDAIEVYCTSLDGTTLDADFNVPVDLSGNIWPEIANGTLDIADTDNDGFGDSGTDAAFSSNDYTGSAPDVALTSTQTSQVSDDGPWVGDASSCMVPPRSIAANNDNQAVALTEDRPR